MSSLQKFHRRTQSLGPPPFSFTTIGSGNDTVGYWLGDASSNKLVVAPKSTEGQEMQEMQWGSYGTTRSTVSTTNGLANTDTLAGFGQTAHPVAYYCKTLTTGGYNTWYLPARNELNTLYSNKSATPFATANSFAGAYYWSSTEYTDIRAWGQYLGSDFFQNYFRKGISHYVRAVRRSTI